MTPDQFYRNQLSRLLAVGAYTGLPASEAHARVWCATFAACLADVEPADVDSAFVAFLGSTDPADRFPPTPGRIRALTPRQRAGEAARGASARAWSAVVKAAGAPERIEHPWAWGGDLPSRAVVDATVAAVNAVGGWAVIGACEPARMAPEFRRAYETACASPTGLVRHGG